MKKINETSEFDYSHERSQLRMDGYKDLNPQAKVKNRKVAARYADNALLAEFDGSSQLDRIQQILNDAGVDDGEIARGVQISRKGIQKIAAAIGVSPNETLALVNSLITSLRDAHREDEIEEDYHASMNETPERFTYEGDVMGNVTIRDSVTGKDCYLQGSEGAEFMDQIDSVEDHDKQQWLMSQYEHVMEGFTPSQLDEDDSYDAEIDSNYSTYNFPWVVNGEHGTGTAGYSGHGPDMKVKLVSVRDSDGEEFQPDQHTLGLIREQALDFIGDA